MQPTNSVLNTAPLTPAQEVSFYLKQAITMIDAEWGEGYAKKNPATVASLVNSMVQCKY